MSEKVGSRHSVVILSTAVALVAGLVGGAAYFSAQGLAPLSGHNTKQLASPWIESGTDAAYAWALVKRTDAMIALAKQVPQKTDNIVLNKFATELEGKANAWRTSIQALMQQHMINPEREIKVFYKDFKQMTSLPKDLEKLTGFAYEKALVSGMNKLAHFESAALQGDSGNATDKQLVELGLQQFEFNKNVSSLFAGWTK